MAASVPLRGGNRRHGPRLRKEEKKMDQVVFYRCETCGNIVALIRKGGGTLTCCGHPMTELHANSTDAAREKHVPVLTREGTKLQVKVGSVKHPMTQEHFIEWIALAEGDRIEIQRLHPGMKPEAHFVCAAPDEDEGTAFVGEGDELVPNCEGNPCNFVYHGKHAPEITVYAYCNLHGLWKAKAE